MKKNVLILSPFFFPEPISTGRFNTDIAIALRDKGYNVTVLCSHPLYPKWVPEKSDEEIPGIKIIRGGKNIRYSKKTFLRRLILELWYAFYVFRNIFTLRKSIDIIIPVFPPSLAFYVMSNFLKKKTKKVGMVHDLQEVYSNKKKGIVSKIVSLLINRIEGTTFRKCHKLIFLSEEMKSTAQELYNLENKELLVQYPFVTIEDTAKTDDLEAVLPKDRIHIVYSGALGEKQNPKGVYDFFEYASQRITNSEFHFFSQGLVFEELKKENNNTAIRFHDLVPRENIEELYAKSTVQIIPQQSGTSKGSLPSKLPNLLVSGCKILFVTDVGSEMESLFNTYELEKIVTSWENEELLTGVKELLNNKQQRMNQIELAKKMFSIESMIEKIV